MRITGALLAILILAACGDDDTVTVYQLQKVDPAKSYGHEWLPLNPRTYRVHETKVVSEIVGILDEYRDCVILSVGNWKCSYPDSSASFGCQNGEYWQDPDLPEDHAVVSRFEYNLVECEWDIGGEGYFWGSIRCFSRWL